MKNKIQSMILLLLCLLMASSPAAAQRNTIWVDGSSQTSRGWFDFRQFMAWEGYQFNSLLDNNYAQAGSNGVLSAASYLDNRIGGAEDVLGIAHGFGGIALRYAQHQNDNIGAMVLCGVPNQGSAAIHKATTAFDGDDTELQKMVELIEALKAGDNCQNCNVTELFKGWINSLEAGSSYLSDLSPDSDIIMDINSPDNLPNVPYLVLYGTVKDFSLTRMLEPRALSDDSDWLTRCHSERILEEQKRIDAQHASALIRSTNNFFATVLEFMGAALTAGTNPGAALTAVGGMIRRESDRLVRQIQDQLAIELELARMLRCQLADQVLEAQWMLTMLEGSVQEREVWVSTTSQADIDECYDDCEVQFPQDVDPNSHHHCLVYCSTDFQVGEYQTITVFVAEDNDGLLRASEQQLDGPFLASPAIHLEHTNHFQETSPGNTALTEAFESIFQGNMGAAFIVPN